MQLARNRLLLSLILASIVAFTAASAHAGTTSLSHRLGGSTASVHVLKPGSTTFNGEPDGGTPHPLEAPKMLVPTRRDENGRVSAPQWFMWIGRVWMLRLLGVS
jgi:hypothetical protein